MHKNTEDGSPRLEIDLGEALRYLGVQEKKASPELLEDLKRCAEAVLTTAKPRTLWRVFDLLPVGSLAGTSFCPQGQAIRMHLQDCSRVILMAATLGMELEQLLRQSQLRNMADAVLLDACASAAIENVCDRLCRNLESEFAPARLTGRFSPGYGDFPLSQQRELFSVLQPERRIGLMLSDSGLMIPQKSVTALIGISMQPIRPAQPKCADCNLYTHCTFRAKGAACGTE